MLQNKITETCFLLQLLHFFILHNHLAKKEFFPFLSFVKLAGKAEKRERKGKRFLKKKNIGNKVKLISRIKSLYIFFGIGFFGFLLSLAFLTDLN